MSTARTTHLVRPRPDSKGAATKQAMMEAARRVFATRGYISATVADIAAEAAKSPATFYKYFASKQDMLEALLSEFLEQVDERQRVPQIRDTSGFEQIRAAVEVFWGVYREFRAEWIAITQAAAVDAEMVQLWLRIRDRGVMRILPLVDRAQERGARLDTDPAVVASNLSAIIEHTAYLWLGLGADGLGRPVDDTAAVNAIAQHWCRVLGEEIE